MLLRQPPSGPSVTNPTFAIPPANVNVSTAALIDVNKGPAQDLTLTANANVLLDHLPDGQTAWYQVFVIQGGAGSFVPTFVGAKTPGGTPLTFSTAPGSVDVVSLCWYRNVLYATIGGLAFA
jgi:hypothetical protein